MSLSVCVKKVRVISPNGNLLSEGEMKCEDIETLQALNYEIIDLEEPSEPDFTTTEEPVVEELPVETETIQIVEQPKPIYAIYEQDIFDRSITLVEEITQAKANNIILTTENNNLKQQLENVFTQQQVNEMKLQHEVNLVHAIISEKNKSVQEGSSQARKIKWSNWTNYAEDQELKLERFANDLGLSYTRRDKIDGEPIYYIKQIHEAVGTTPESIIYFSNEIGGGVY